MSPKCIAYLPASLANSSCGWHISKLGNTSLAAPATQPPPTQLQCCRYRRCSYDATTANAAAMLPLLTLLLRRNHRQRSCNAAVTDVALATQPPPTQLQCCRYRRCSYDATTANAAAMLPLLTLLLQR